MVDSELVTSLRESNILMPNEEMHHYLVYHNEEEYCEVVASGFEVERDTDRRPVIK